MFHHGVDGTANHEVHPAFFFIGIPDVLHIAEQRGVNAFELLKLVNDEREVLTLGELHQYFEQLGKAGEVPEGFSQFVFPTRLRPTIIVICADSADIFSVSRKSANSCVLS